jgi:hypothetical protein
LENRLRIEENKFLIPSVKSGPANNTGDPNFLSPPSQNRNPVPIYH